MVTAPKLLSHNHELQLSYTYSQPGSKAPKTAEWSVWIMSAIYKICWKSIQSQLLTNYSHLRIAFIYLFIGNKLGRKKIHQGKCMYHHKEMKILVYNNNKAKISPGSLQWPREWSSLDGKHKNGTCFHWSWAHECSLQRLKTIPWQNLDWQMPNNLHLCPNK